MLEGAIHLVNPVLIFGWVAHVGAVSCYEVEVRVKLPHHQGFIPGMDDVHVCKVLYDGQTQFVPPATFNQILQYRGF